MTAFLLSLLCGAGSVVGVTYALSTREDGTLTVVVSALAAYLVYYLYGMYVEYDLNLQAFHSGAKMSIKTQDEEDSE